MTATAEATPTPAPSTTEATQQTAPAEAAPKYNTPTFPASALKAVFGAAARNDPRKVFLGVRLRMEEGEKCSLAASDGKVLAIATCHMDELGASATGLLQPDSFVDGFGPLKYEGENVVLASETIKSILAHGKAGAALHLQKQDTVRLESGPGGSVWVRNVMGHALQLHNPYIEGRYPNAEGVFPTAGSQRRTDAPFGLNARLACELFQIVAALSDGKAGYPCVVHYYGPTKPVVIEDCRVFDSPMRFRGLLMPLKLAEVPGVPERDEAPGDSEA